MLDIVTLFANSFGWSGLASDVASVLVLVVLSSLFKVFTPKYMYIFYISPSHGDVAVRADEESPAKILASEINSEYEDSFSNSTNS